MKGISRIDSQSTHGWFVRVYRDGSVHSKFFSDGVHGGKRKALTAAREYKAEYEREHPAGPLPGYPSVPFRTRPPRNNTSGVVGVSETFQRARDGSRLRCFCVSWCPRRNTPRSKRFYHHLYDSREEAFKAAVEFRKAREEEILRRFVNGKYK